VLFVKNVSVLSQVIRLIFKNVTQYAQGNGVGLYHNLEDTKTIKLVIKLKQNSKMVGL